MSGLNIQPVELVLRNSSEHIDVYLVDVNGNPIDATELTLTIMDLNETVMHKDAYPQFTLTGTVSVGAGSVNVTGTNTEFGLEVTDTDQLTIAAETKIVSVVGSDLTLTLTTPHVAGASGVTATKATRIVKPTGTTGQYYFEFGASAAPANTPDQTETNIASDYLFHWGVRGAPGSEKVHQVQTVKVVTAKTLRLVPYFRGIIDKAVKLVNDDPTNPCFLGYTDAQLVQYLEGGLHYWNMYEPYPVWYSLDQFPEIYLQGLFEAALITGVMSQTLFAIDTDVPQYSDQGNTFVIQHQPGLTAFLNQISQRLDKLIPIAKKKFVSSGTLHIEAGPNYRLNTLLNAAPYGSTFRNVFFAS